MKNMQLKAIKEIHYIFVFKALSSPNSLIYVGQSGWRQFLEAIFPGVVMVGSCFVVFFCWGGAGGWVGAISEGLPITLNLDIIFSLSIRTVRPEQTL